MKGYTSMIDGHIDEDVNGKKEYIDREALIAEYDRVHQGPAGGARKLVVDAPAADAVEVVRCKDCKYWQDNNGGYPHEECRWGKDETPDEYDFCSYGERKEQR